MTGVLIKTSRSEEIEVNWRLKEYLSALEISFQTGLGALPTHSAEGDLRNVGVGRAIDSSQSHPTHAESHHPVQSQLWPPAARHGVGPRDWNHSVGRRSNRINGLSLQPGSHHPRAIRGRVRQRHRV